MNFAWVIITAALTIADTFRRPIPGEIGYGTVTSLTYLLPLVIGWLHVRSEPEPNHLKESLEEASNVPLVATDDGSEPVLAGRPNRAIEYVKRMEVNDVRRDESKANPIFNYSRVFVWSQVAEIIFTLARNATANAERGHPVYRPTTIDGQETDTATEGRSWTTHEVIPYCEAVDTQFEGFSEGEPRPPTPLPPGSDGSHDVEAGLLPFSVPYTGILEPSLWAAGVWKRVALTTGIALGLQWGTTGAGIPGRPRMPIYFAADVRNFRHGIVPPPPGVECTSASL